MAKFHITKSGRTAPCKATVQACPLGEANHYDSLEDASLAAAQGDFSSRLDDVNEELNSRYVNLDEDYGSPFYEWDWINSDDPEEYDSQIEVLKEYERDSRDLGDKEAAENWAAIREAVLKVAPRPMSEEARAFDSALGFLVIGRWEGNLRVFPGSTREDLPPEAVASALSAFYQADVTNYARGGKGAYAGQEAVKWLTIQAGPQLPEGTSPRWAPKLGSDASGDVQAVLEGVFDPKNPNTLYEWRQSERWARASELFPEVFEVLDGRLEEVHYNRDLL